MRALTALSAAVLLALGGVACTNKALGGETAGTRISSRQSHNLVIFPVGKRKRAPKFAGRDFAGQTVGSVTVAGKVSVVVFWASWCGPCREEEPVFVRLWNSYKDRVAFLGVNVRDRKADAQSFIDEFKVPYPSLYNFDAGMADKFRVSTFPETVVLDKSGRIAARVFGPATSQAELAKLLDSELLRSP